MKLAKNEYKSEKFCQFKNKKNQTLCFSSCKGLKRPQPSQVKRSAVLPQATRSRFNCSPSHSGVVFLNKKLTAVSSAGQLQQAILN